MDLVDWSGFFLYGLFLRYFVKEDLGFVLRWMGGGRC